MKKTSLHIAVITKAKPKVEATAIVDTIYDLYQGDVVRTLFIDRMAASITPKKK